MNKSSTEPLIVIFGGAGYIGSCLTRLLLSEGFRVRVVDNFLFSSDGIYDLNSPSLEVVEADITETRAVSYACHGADTVILLAALVGHRSFDIPGLSIRDVNFLASSTVLDAAVEHGAQRFLFASTNSVYGIQEGIMYETAIPEPISLYSRLKLRMEERVLNSKTRSFHPTALRIATCHGYSPRMRFDLVVNSIVRDALCRREVTVESSGEQWRSFIHVEDAARAFLCCLKAHVNMTSGEIFNIGASDQNVQVKQIISIVRKLVPDLEVRVKEGEPDLRNYRLSSSKIEKLLDFRCEKSLSSSIEEMHSILTREPLEDPFSLRYHNT